MGLGAIALWAFVLPGCSIGKGGKDWLGAAESSTGQGGNTGALSTTQEPAGNPTRTSQGSSDFTAGSSRDEGQSNASTTTPAGSTETSGSTRTSDQGAGDPSTGTGEGAGTEEPLPAGKGFACGVAISRVSINQSVEIALSQGPKLLPVTQERERVWGFRDSLFRVYLDKRAPGTKRVKVTFEIANGATQLRREVELDLAASSTERSIESTANFLVPNLMISSQTRYRVLVKQDKPCTPGPQDRAMVPRHGSWELSARSAPDVDIQFVRLAFLGEEPIAPLTQAFRMKLIDTLRARYPIRLIRFNLRDSRIMRIPMERGETGDPAMVMLDQLSQARAGVEGPNSKLHYIGLGSMGPSGAGIGAAPTKDEPGVCVVNSQADDNKLISRIVSMVGRLHGLSQSDCAKGSSPAHPDKIGVWGFDTLRSAVLEPDRYHDISCGKSPDWIHHASYAKFAKRAQNIANR